MSRWLRWAAAAGLGLALAACVPEFEHALEGGNPADPALLGVWTARGADDENAMQLEIAAAEGGVTLKMIDPQGKEKSILFNGRTAEVGGVSYLSLTPDDSESLGAGKTKVGYMIFRYAADGDGFKVWSFDDTAVAKAIQDGKLKGTVTGSGPEVSPRISSSPAEVAAWIATDEGQAAFKDAEPGDVLILTRNKP